MAVSPLPRSDSRASCYSTTTYHSFQDVEVYEPGSQSETCATSTARRPKGAGSTETPVRRSRPSRRDDLDKRPSSFQMVRQDSGYESSTTPPHSSGSANRRRRRPKQTSPSPPRTDSAPKRPALRRGAGGPISHVPGRSSLTLSRPTSLSQQHQNLDRKHSYFQFPSPERLDDPDQSSQARQSIDLAPVILKVNTANASTDDDDERPESSSHHHDRYPRVDSPVSPISPSVPPQTTHYWTSDRTRRLEYAAIDAASRGVRGWVMRNMVPDCFVPKDNRRVGFDDDGGSVRRYRLDLEIECPEDSVPPSPVGEQLRGFRARGSAKPGWWARLRGCS